MLIEGNIFLFHSRVIIVGQVWVDNALAIVGWHKYMIYADNIQTNIPSDQFWWVFVVILIDIHKCKIHL